jgi:DNA polymerase I-like protein with 3'-5' exonuclease and polymerase domains
VTESPLEHVKLHLVDSIDKLWQMKEWAGERRETPLGFDTETGGLSVEKDKLRLIQLGDLNHGWAVPFEMWGGGALEILSQYEGPLVGHNVPFDTRFIGYHAGWQAPWHKIHDTMTMAHLVNPRFPKGKMMSAGLKQLGDALIDPRASSGQAALSEGMRKQKWTWATVPLTFAPYWIYGALDPVLTCHVWRKLSPEVESSFSEVYDFERAVSRVLTAMMLKGMLIDVPYTEKKIDDIDTFSRDGRKWLSTTFGIDSPMSGLSIARTIESYGQEIIWRTEHGQPQMDKEALRYYGDNAAAPLVRELCTTVLTLRHAEKMRGTYLENLLGLRDKSDCVHASIWSLGARTSRMSVTDPALQTLPRDDLIVRGCFIPRPGCVLISIDASQIESRLAAHFSGDRGLIEAFRAADKGGGDFFCEVATEIFGEKITKQDKRRQHTKNTVYGSIYGAGSDKMALTAGVSPAVMAPVKQAFDARFPGLRELQNRILAEARQHNPMCVYTPLGRRLLLDDERAYTQGTNALIQGHAAEILKKGLLDLDAAGFGDCLLLPVHDEVILEVPEGNAEDALRQVGKILTNRTDYAVPLTWDGKIMEERWIKT